MTAQYLTSNSALVRLQNICRYSSLLLICCLAFLAFFDASRNIDMQGLVLLVAGAFAWIAITLDNKPYTRLLSPWQIALVGIFIMSSVTSLAVNPHKVYGLLGAPYMRLGTLGLLACIGCGLLVRRLRTQVLITGLYGGICALALLSIPYSLLKFHSLWRIGGVFAQADIMACFVGVGLVLGFGLITSYPRWRKRIISAQLLLTLLLLLTQTRAVLLLVLGLYILWQLQHRGLKQLPKIFLVLGANLVVFIGIHYFTPNRLVNTAYVSESFHYRLSLQHAALQSSAARPLWGYGPGNLSDALACPTLHFPTLQETCHHGYFFNSSHNIFIDRLLAIGWIGGSAFLAFVIYTIYRGLRNTAEAQLFSYGAILIAGYYLTNVTSLTLELLFWVILLGSPATNPVQVTNSNHY